MELTQFLWSKKNHKPLFTHHDDATMIEMGFYITDVPFDLESIWSSLLVTVTLGGNDTKPYDDFYYTKVF